VPALGEPVVVDELGIGLFRPTLWGRVELVREDADGHRDGDAFDIEKPLPPVLPVEAAARDPVFVNQRS
jgi:hypothetical protein